MEEDDNSKVDKTTQEEDKRNKLEKEENEEEESLYVNDEKNCNMKQLLYQIDLLLFRLE